MICIQYFVVYYFFRSFMMLLVFVVWKKFFQISWNAINPVKCNQSRPGFELLLSYPFPRTITITPQALPHYTTGTSPLHHRHFLEGRRIYRPKRFGNNNNDEDNSPKTLNDKSHQALSQKFRQLLTNYILHLEQTLFWIY